MGPTAVGKTAVAVHIAQLIGGEIISADSMQVYKGMDIGTAKPPLSQRQQVVFHLLDLVYPDQPFTVADWKNAAESAIMTATGYRKQSIVCGGTGLYVRALLENWSFADTGAQSDIRTELQNEITQLGSQTLHSRLKAVDSLTASRVHPNDAVRIVRALEVYYKSGRPISELQAEDKSLAEERRALCIGLTRPRSSLYTSIEKRVDEMILNGLEAEVKGLLESGYSPDMGPLRSLGYKEMIAYLQGKMDYMAAIEAIKQNTRRYSKRQETWFRAQSGITWIDVTGLEAHEVAAIVVVKLDQMR